MFQNIWNIFIFLYKIKWFWWNQLTPPSPSAGSTNFIDFFYSSNPFLSDKFRTQINRINTSLSPTAYLTSLQNMNLRTLRTKTPETPITKVRIEERRKHHHFLSLKHSSGPTSYQQTTVRMGRLKNHWEFHFFTFTFTKFQSRSNFVLAIFQLLEINI